VGEVQGWLGGAVVTTDQEARTSEVVAVASGVPAGFRALGEDPGAAFLREVDLEGGGADEAAVADSGVHKSLRIDHGFKIQGIHCNSDFTSCATISNRLVRSLCTGTS
jgi:hypothetical protein